MSEADWKSIVMTQREKVERDAAIEDVLFETREVFGGVGIEPIAGAGATFPRSRQVAWSIP